MSIYNLIECSKNYSKTTGSLQNYYRDDPSSSAVGDTNYSIKDSKSFDQGTNITGILEGNHTEKEVQIVLPIKYLSNFWKTLDIPVINCQINLILTCSENCIITSETIGDADPDADHTIAAINKPTNATFKIKYTKLFIFARLFIYF